MKVLIAVLCAFVVTGAFAEEEVTQKVADRASCADIQAQITELGAIEGADEETVAELANLKADYRRSCTKSARGRRVSTNSHKVTTVTEEVEEVQETDTEEKPAEEEVVSVEEAAVETVDPVAEAEKELANLDAGLCADGSKPNKYGCCGDEVFKDLGDTVFACCPKSGGDCFPPLK